MFSNLKFSKKYGGIAVWNHLHTQAKLVNEIYAYAL